MKKILLSILLLPLAFTTFSSHIVGGEFELRYLDKNSYQLNLYLYFDAVNGFPQLLNQDVYAHIFRKRDNQLMQVIYLPKITDENVPYYQQWCSYDEVQTTRIIYGETITLADDMYNDPGGYYIAYENCCRNWDVTNVKTGEPINSGNNDPTANNDFSGQTYYLEFPPVVKDGAPFINSSPSQFRPLTSYACPGVAYWSDFSGIDVDGDKLTYEIVSPLDNLPDREPDITRPAPYPSVQWQSGFSLQNVMNGDPGLSITPDGLLSVTPQSNGLYVFAVKVTESRDGEKISEMIREFQLFVTDICNPAVPPLIHGKKITDAEYTEQHEMSVTFDNTVSAEDRCVSIRVSDADAGTSEEYMLIQAIPLNFDDDLSELLPEDNDVVLKNGGTAIFDICFPECPLIDPNVSDFYEIGILAMDDTCPLPLIDTLRVKVYLTPPVNNEPELTAGGSSAEVFSHEVSESAGGSFSVALNGFDVDGQDLNLLVFPQGFVMEEVGMSFTTPEYNPGAVSTTFNWDYDCNSNFDYSQGKVVPSGPNETKRAFNTLVVLEDMDDCEFARADSIMLNMVIRFPDELPPEISMVGENPNQKEFEYTYPVTEQISFQVKAVDGFPDSDNLNVSAYGVGFDLGEVGASFTGISDGSGVEPGSVADFVWPVNCELIDLVIKDSYEVHFVASDINDCRLANSDTLKVQFNFEEVTNNAPEIEIQSIPGEVVVVDNELTVDAFTDVRFNVVGTDIDNDSLFLQLDFVVGSNEVTNYQFETKAAKGFVNSEFTFDLGCEFLAEGFQAGNYLFSFLLTDKSCDEPLLDKVSVKITVTDAESFDEFLPPNAISPNDDGVNDYFSMIVYNEISGENESILPPDKCSGRFEFIEIFNRWGKEVFRDSDRDFQWGAEGLNPGTYYYRIAFSDKDFRGTITVLY